MIMNLNKLLLMEYIFLEKKGNAFNTSIFVVNANNNNNVTNNMNIMNIIQKKINQQKNCMEKIIF